METDEKTAVELDVQVTLEDYMRINWWHEMHTTVAKAGLAAWVVGLLALAAIAAAVPPARGVCLAVAVCALLLWLVVWARWTWAVRRAYTSNKPAQVSHHYSFSQGGVSTESSMNAGKQTWDCYWRAVEAPTAFCLYIANHLVQLLPKRCFASEEQMQRFRNIVRAGMGEKAKGIRG